MGVENDDNDYFELSGDYLILNTLQIMRPNLLTNLEFNPTDNSGVSISKNFSVNLYDLNEPTNIALSASTFNENITSGSVVDIINYRCGFI